MGNFHHSSLFNKVRVVILMFELLVKYLKSAQQKTDKSMALINTIPTKPARVMKIYSMFSDITYS